MTLDGFREGAEDDTDFGQLCLEGGGYRHRVDDGVHGYSAEPLLFGQRDSQLVEHRPQLGINVIQTGQ